jgi:hypothetical protein
LLVEELRFEISGTKGSSKERCTDEIGINEFSLQQLSSDKIDKICLRLAHPLGQADLMLERSFARFAMQANRR